MRVNIENCVRHCGVTGIYKHSLGELVANLKELRERTTAGDMTVLDEFFKIYTFDADDSKPSNFEGKGLAATKATKGNKS